MLRAVAVLIALPVVAQVQRTNLLGVEDLFADACWPAPAQAPAARGEALQDLLASLLECEGGQVLRVAQQRHLMLRGTTEQLQALQELLLELRQQQSRPLQLQITVLQVPAALAKQHALETQKGKPVQVPAMTQLLRDVQAAGGRMSNLPPTTAATLQLVQPTMPAPRADAKAAGVPSLALQALAFGGKAAVRVALTPGPGKPGGSPRQTQLPTVLLAPGDGVLLTHQDGEQATVVWLRLLSIGEPQLRDAGRAGAPAAPAIRTVPRK